MFHHRRLLSPQLTPAFSLVELLVVISIATIFITLGFSAYRKTQNRQLLHSAVNKTQSILKTVQKQAEIGNKDCHNSFQYYLVDIPSNNNQITVQAICRNSQGVQQIYTIDNITFTQGCRLHFQPLQTGLIITSPSTNSCNLTLQLQSNSQLTATINIAQPGIIQANF